MLLGSLASTVRRLLVERERARRAAGDRRIASFNEWQAVVLPSIPDEELGGKKPYGFWMKYQALLRFSRDELLDALAGLAEADVAMKTGQDGRIRLERVLIEIANAPPDVSARELDALRAEIEQRGILFRLRVVSSEMRTRESVMSPTPTGP